MWWIAEASGGIRDPGVDQGVEQLVVGAAVEVDTDDGDFDDAIDLRVEAGGLEVDDEGGSGRVSKHIHLMFQLRLVGS